MARVRQAKRAGGYVATPHGWRLVSQATPDELGDTGQPADVEETVDEPVESPAEPVAASPYAERTECPDCGKDVAINKDGSLRKHTCEISAPAPEVTFEGGQDGGDSAAEGW